MALTAAQLARVRRMAAEPTEDTYTDADIDTLADQVAKVVDASGYAPSHADYTDTYDLYILTAEIWREKAGNVADEYDFVAEGAEFSRSQKYTTFLSQAARYADMASVRSTNTS